MRLAFVNESNRRETKALVGIVVQRITLNLQARQARRG